jgi:hypothetical protein
VTLNAPLFVFRLTFEFSHLFQKKCKLKEAVNLPPDKVETLIKRNASGFVVLLKSATFEVTSMFEKMCGEWVKIDKYSWNFT